MVGKRHRVRPQEGEALSVASANEVRLVRTCRDDVSVVLGNVDWDVFDVGIVVISPVEPVGRPLGRPRLVEDVDERLLVAGLAGYVAGVSVAYPGRAFSLTAIMAGIVLVVIEGLPTTGGDR